MSTFTHFMRWFTGAPLDEDGEEQGSQAADTPSKRSAQNGTRAYGEQARGASGDEADGQLASAGVIQGVIENGGGMMLQLYLEDEIVAQGTLGESGRFRLRNLIPGVYTIRVYSSAHSTAMVESDAIAMDGQEKVELQLKVGAKPAPSTELTRTTTRSPSPAPTAVTSPAPAGRPMPEREKAVEGAGSSRGTAESPNGVHSESETRNGTVATATAAAEQADTPAVPATSIMENYVLFGQPGQLATRMYIMLLLDTLLAANVSFGCRPDDAMLARKVLVVGFHSEVPELVIEHLRGNGVQVKRIQGAAEDIVRQVESSL